MLQNSPINQLPKHVLDKLIMLTHLFMISREHFNTSNYFSSITQINFSYCLPYYCSPKRFLFKYKKMLHKPTQRKVPKKYENQQQEHNNEIKKASSKPIMRTATTQGNKPNQRQASVRGRVNKVQQKMDKVVKGMSNAALQNLLIEQIKGIKNELKQIKQQIGIQGSEQKRMPLRQQQQQQYEKSEGEEDQEQQNIYNIQARPKVEEMSHVPVTQNKVSRETPIHNESNMQEAPRGTNYQLATKPKQLMDVGKIQPYMKDFKIEVTKTLMPYYNGYHKKSSKPVIIKYCPQNKSMEPIFNLYEKLWKNIVKSKYICINKVYDINEPLATYILVIEANKYSLSQLLAARVATVSQIMTSLVKALQFFHQCGYLYRNIHPLHVMYSYDNEVVLIDLKNVKRFVDIKGKHVTVVRENEQYTDQFISNSRARGLKEGRKDDLESLGYLGLFILQGCLPWNINNLVQVRSKLTLKQLCGKYQGLLEFMICVAQMGTQDVPDYEKLIGCLSTL